MLHTAAESAPARLHGDANVLVLGADFIDAETAQKILQIFLETAALGDRYAEPREPLEKLDVSSMAASVGQRLDVAIGAFKAPEPDKALDAEIAGTFLKPKQ